MGEAFYCYDADVWCKDCLPIPTNSREVGYCSPGQETDCPDHCAGCHKPLDYSLTSDGVDYVIEHILEAVRRKDYLNKSVVYTWPENPDYYYEGRPAWAVVYDWAKELEWYTLSVKHSNLVRRFIQLCDKTQKEMNNDARSL